MKNLDLRLLVAESGLQWKEIAAAIGISPSYLSRLLKNDLSLENKMRIMEAVGRLKAI